NGSAHVRHDIAEVEAGGALGDGGRSGAAERSAPAQRSLVAPHPIDIERTPGPARRSGWGSAAKTGKSTQKSGRRRVPRLRREPFPTLPPFLSIIPSRESLNQRLE